MPKELSFSFIREKEVRENQTRVITKKVMDRFLPMLYATMGKKSKEKIGKSRTAKYDQTEVATKMIRFWMGNFLKSFLTNKGRAKLKRASVYKNFISPKCKPLVMFKFSKKLID